MREAEHVRLSSGSAGSVWSEEIHLLTAEALATYSDGPAAQGPAITRNTFGRGVARYISTKLDGAELTTVVLDAVKEAGVDFQQNGHDGLEVSVRGTETGKFTFLINHSEQDATVSAQGQELITDAAVVDTVGVPAGAVRVVHTGMTAQPW